MVVVKKEKSIGERSPTRQGDNSLRGHSLGGQKEAGPTQSCIYSIYSQALGQELQVQREPASLAREAAGLLRCEGLRPGPQQLCLL